MELSPRAREILDEIHGIVINEPFGRTHEEALLRIEGLAANFKWQVFDPDVIRRVDSILAWSRILYSPHQHESWSGGASLVRDYILQDLAACHPGRVPRQPKGAHQRLGERGTPTPASPEPQR